MNLLDPITLERFARFRRNRPGWWSLLALLALSFLALLGPLLVGNRPLVLKVDGVTRFPVFAGFISGRELGLAIEGEPNYRLLAEQLKAGGRGWLVLPPVPFAPDEVCEVMPSVSRDADGRWQDPRGVIAEGRIFTLNADGTRRQTWTIINGRPSGDARLFNEGVGVARAKLVDGQAVKRMPADVLVNEGRALARAGEVCAPYLGTVLAADKSCEFSITRWVEGDYSGPDHVNVFTAHAEDNDKTDATDDDDARFRAWMALQSEQAGEPAVDPVDVVGGDPQVFHRLRLLPVGCENCDRVNIAAVASDQSAAA